MNFNLESGKSEKINETPEIKVDSEQLSETEETAENFDDCALNEVQDSKESEVNAESLEDAEEDYDDCEAKMGEMEEKNPELTEEDDDFSDCGKETDGQYVAEVTYTTDGEIGQEEVSAELQEAYNECDDPEDMQRLKENANENEHIEVHNAEVVERPQNSELDEGVTEKEYEAAQKEVEEAQENLEAQQEAAQEYQGNLENQINKHEDNVSEETENINNEVPEKTKDSDEVEKNAEEAEKSDGGKIGAKDLENMEAGSKVETTEIDEENISENISQEVEEKTDTALSDETKEQVAEEVSDEINFEAKNGEISATEAEEIVAEKRSEAVESVDEQSETMDEEIEQKAGEVAEQDDLAEKEAKEQIFEEVSENASETLSDDDVDAMVEGKSEAIEETVEEKVEEQKAVDAVEGIEDEFEKEKTEQLPEQTEQSLQERIDDAFVKENVTAAEINSLRDEHSAELQSKIEEKQSAEAELKSKFDAVLSKEKGSDEYRQSLLEYNTLLEQKNEITDQISAMEKQQDLLDKKSIELRAAQIRKGAEAMEVSAATLSVVDILQERYDQTYYDKKADKTELASIRDDSCSTIKELFAEKDSIKQAMDAKMDEIAEYVTSNNMDRYATAHDLHYQQLSEEYSAMKERYGRIRYSIINLDENNKAITERLGDEYVSMAELPPRSKISEVNDGTDIPSKTNYFLDEAKASEVLSCFKQGDWEQLTIQEQKQAVEKLADYNAEILGVEDKPRIIYYNAEDPCDYGEYIAKYNAIRINEYNMHNTAEMADTISHEYRHKYQHDRAEKLENARDLEFKKGTFENYIAPEGDYAAYRNQLVEADARAYARVIREKISAASDIEAVGIEPKMESDGSPTAFETIDPEKGTVRDVPPYSESNKEIGHSVSDVLERAPQSIEQQKFLTNDGEQLTYGEAVNRITANAEKYMSSLNVSDDIKASVVADIRSELYGQHLEAASRGLGDHGIRHIFGNYERGEQYLASRSDITVEQKLAVLISQVYHDEGYTVSPNNLGTLNEGNDDSKHDRASAVIWNDPERQNIYRQVFSDNALNSIEVAIGKHNSNKINDIQSNTSIEADPVVSTVHICDKLALSQREKLSELLISNPRLIELTEGTNSTLTILKDERFELYENGELTSQGKKLLDAYHQAINAHIDSQGYDSEYAERLKNAVNKDVGFNSGKFSSCMNYIYTPSDCFQYNPETGRNEITVYTIEYPDGASNDLANKQVGKLFKDLGLSDPEIELAVADGGYDFGETRGLSVKIKSIKEDEIRQIEAERFQENDDLKEVNECIETGRRKCSEMSQKLIKVVSLVGGKNLSFSPYREAAFIGDVVVDFNEQEFKSYSPAKKEQLVRGIVSNIVLSNTSNILNKQKG